MNNEVFGDQLRAQLLADHCDDGVAFTADATDDRALLRLAQLIGSKELLYREPDGDYVVPFTAGDRKRLARILHTRART